MNVNFYLLGEILKKRDIFIYKQYKFKLLYEQTKLHH